MKRAKLIFPLMFLVALAGSAFTRYSASSSKKEVITAYYYDQGYGSCNTTSIDDGQCITDNVGSLCYMFVYDYGTYTLMFQNWLPSTCYQPFYSYY